MFARGQQGRFISFLEFVEAQGRRTLIKGNSGVLQKACKVYDVELPGAEFDFQGTDFDGEFADTPKSRALMYAWLSSKKGIRFGALLAETLGTDCVPACYERIIRKATGF